ncbi:MAG: capsule biosynthesis protein [Sphingomonadales bacterium]|nr:capsule biosynthesis protein [Sphingomonadales bacterium]
MLNKLPQTRRDSKLPFIEDEAGNVAVPGEDQLDVLGAVPPARTRPQRRRRSVMAWTLALFVAVPTILATFYFGLIASDQYVVEMRFAVKNTNQSQSTDVLGLFAGIPAATSAVTDSYIVIDHMMSRELLDKLEEKIGIRAIYSRPEVDYLSRFDNSESSEEFVKYWRKMVKASFDGASQIVAVDVKAFTREDAKLVAENILLLSEDLVNDLSARARADAVKHAQQEVKRMEDRLRVNRTALRSFRDTEQEFDPAKKVESRYVILGKLEEEVTSRKARLSNLRSFMGAEAPSVKVLLSEIAGLERQLEEERAKLGRAELGKGGTTQSIGGLAANYEELVVDREFAEKSYLSALASLERARIEADRQQRYLAAFVRPTLPQEALYPKRILAICAVLGISLVLWALGVLITYAVRDHAL